MDAVGKPALRILTAAHQGLKVEQAEQKAGSRQQQGKRMNGRWPAHQSLWAPEPDDRQNQHGRQHGQG
ncbi:hypothetical protein SDC9_186860 [bioreactor metagenome]|uniref:Uncharacterized protein n=1 Tax=bioreactor metagenome TaxID=1076179 RepID=A0A645HLL6_9ZZZZ